MNEIRTAAVLGLGLMGGSVARELAVRGIRVLGFDTDPMARLGALRDGVVEAMLPPSLEGIEAAEVIVIAVPVRAAVELVLRLGHCPGAGLVTDVGSTKESILEAARRSRVGDRFVGAHPLAGDHRAGWEASRLGMFLQARVFLSPADGATPQAMRAAETFWADLGAHPRWIREDEHDQRLAWTSHLPQLTSTALGNLLADRGIPRAELGPGGRDVTRLAASTPEMWTEIALDNAGHLLGAVERLQAELDFLRRALSTGDEAVLRGWFRSARGWAEASPEAPKTGRGGVAAPGRAG